MISNTFNTRTEARELALSVRVERYELRLGPGEAGMHSGGDGVVREQRVLERCCIRTQRRSVASDGAQGAEGRLPGRSFLNIEELRAIANLDLRPGDLLRNEALAGGRWGSHSGDT